MQVRGGTFVVCVVCVTCVTCVTCVMCVTCAMCDMCAGDGCAGADGQVSGDRE